MDKTKERFLGAIRFGIYATIILWSIHIFSLITNTQVGHYGIFPRTLYGLKGIITAPLVHGDFSHLTSNTFPFFVLSGTIYFFYRKVAWPSFVLIYLLTGFMVWLFGRPVYHIGASGVVYGLMSFILFSGIFRRNFRSIALALAITVLYSGYFYGILPTKDGISWESHLFGAFVGIFIAFVFKNVTEFEERTQEPSWANETQEQQYFFPRDTFDKSKKERLLEQQQRESQDWEKDIT